MVDQANGGSQNEQAELTENTAAAPRSISQLQQKMKVSGTVKRLELYGAFIDIDLDKPAILHISKLSKRVNRISDALAVGDEIEVWIESVDEQKNQVTLTMQEPLAVEWRDLKKGQSYTGSVTRLEKFGAFVDIGAEKEGLVHISELSHDFIKHPSEAVKQGDEIQVLILDYNKRKRRIDLSRKALLETLVEENEVEVVEIDEDEEEEMPTAMEIALRQAMVETSDDEAAVKAGTSSGGKSASKKREQQDDILSRTLKLSQETNG
jgi:ribosomal protein S1